MEDLEQFIFLIFDKTFPNEGINRYLSLIKKQYASRVTVNASFEKALVLFQRLGRMPNYEIYAHFPNAIELFHKATSEECRNRQLLAYLGEMICYWYQRDYNNVRQLQKNINTIQFNSSWWERNKKDVTGIVGGLLAGACALVGGASTQVAGMGGVKSGQALMDGVSSIEFEENQFHQLKNAICKINFSNT
ncbi:MAG: hypothetical protein PUD79_04535 [Prevotellaceae bacterium]|nr:hypothetical protein [Prevotellaceae bacterium]